MIKSEVKKGTTTLGPEEITTLYFAFATPTPSLTQTVHSGLSSLMSGREEVAHPDGCWEWAIDQNRISPYPKVSAPGWVRPWA